MGQLDGVHGLAAVDAFYQRLMDQLAHLGGGDDLVGGVFLGDVGGAVAGVEDGVNGLLDGFGVGFEIGRVTQDHRGGEDRAEGVGLAVPAMSGALPCTGS